MKNSGFTLIETLVAISIVMLAVVGPMFSASRSLVAAEISRDQLTASYLAQEGVEYVRSRRDGSYLSAYRLGTYPDVSGTAWNAFLSSGGTTSWSVGDCVSTVSTPIQCAFDPKEVDQSRVLRTCTSSSPCGPLYLASDGVYTQKTDSGTITPFTRTIELRDVSTPAECGATISSCDIQVTSTVSWSFHGTPYSVRSVDHLTPW